ncbi:MAG TPA: SIR2 family protein [Acidobacteriota bacterium]|nr:SIR2 family protein [Acidobacteriota bacterium]
MDLGEIKKRIQEHFTDGLVIIVGSGTSVAQGLPSMAQLAEHLIANPPELASGEQTKLWENVASSLKAGNDLEATLQDVELDEHLESHVVGEVASLIEDRERDALCRILRDGVRLPMSELLSHLFKTRRSLTVITTNYDRLVEFAAERIGLRVDSTFVGTFFGHFDPQSSKESLTVAVTMRRKPTRFQKTYIPHITVLKPHGSLGWFGHEGGIVRCGLHVNLPRLLIAPGKTKLRRGYEPPFDRHREMANLAIDSAASLLILGYGFGDGELHTHLLPRVSAGCPCLVMTRSLSLKAAHFLKSASRVIALSSNGVNGEDGTRAFVNGDTADFAGVSLWDLEILHSEVLQ